MPVCDGVAFGAMIAFSLWRCGLSTSKSGAYGWPEPIAYAGMPGIEADVRAATFREYGGPEVMLWEEIDDPVPGPDEVVIEVRACGLNHSDLDSRAGTSRWPFPMPWVLGAEFAGKVAAIGADVEGIAPGDPVTAYQQYACGTCAACVRWRQDLCERFVVFGTDRWGGYAELAAVPARAVIPLEGEYDFVPAAAAQCVVSTAWSMVMSVAAVRAGETVLVPSASGGVAGAAVQAALIAGARVIASVGAPEKADAVRALGADEVFCYLETPVEEAVAEATGGRGVDVVVDTTGGPRFAEHLDGARARRPPGHVRRPRRRGRPARHHRPLPPRASHPRIPDGDPGRDPNGAPDGARRADHRSGRPHLPALGGGDAHAYMDDRRHVGKIVLVP